MYPFDYNMQESWWW